MKEREGAQRSPARRKPGRPALPPGKAKHYSFGIRTTADLKEKMEASAAAARRSIAREVEFQLERAYLRENDPRLEQAYFTAYVRAVEQVLPPEVNAAIIQRAHELLTASLTKVKRSRDRIASMHKLIEKGKQTPTKA